MRPLSHFIHSMVRLLNRRRIANRRFTASSRFPANGLHLSANKRMLTFSQLLKMAACAILVRIFLFSSLINTTNGYCNACPKLASLSCPTIASIYSWSSYVRTCPDSNSYLTIDSLQVAQSDEDEDSFIVMVMDEENFNYYQNGHYYGYSGSIGTGTTSTTCYQSSSSVSFPAGTKVYTVVCHMQEHNRDLQLETEDSRHVPFY